MSLTVAAACGSGQLSPEHGFRPTDLEQLAILSTTDFNHESWMTGLAGENEDS